MKEIVFTKPPYMNPSERRIADMHSILNILRILIGELSLTHPVPEEIYERHKAIESELVQVTQEIKEGAEIAKLMERLRRSGQEVVGVFKELLGAESGEGRKAELQKSLENIKSVFAVLGKRLDEFEMRSDNPDVWIQIDAPAFRKQFEDVFMAIARNSKGSYAIQFNLEQKAKRDYYIDLRVDTEPAGRALWMPLRLLDVIRDLAANARKYMPPGGAVALSIYQDHSKLEAVVEDSGCGIPDAEIEKVAEYGYRASNVRRRPTLGGGFGLTKAAWLVTSWGGSLTLRSEVNKGTKVHLSIPCPVLPEKPLKWT